MKTIQITNEILNKIVENKPSRFDMAVNFYCCLKQNDKYYLVTYYYNPAWDLWYPFYDDEYEKAIANALRPALMQVGIDKKVLPLRGPSKFVNSDYIYTFECNGTMDNFVGVEKIYKNNELIYELYCYGGIIK